MNIFDSFWGPGRPTKPATDKAWKRSKSIAWDEKWQSLPPTARIAYLTQVKAPHREGSATIQATPADKIPADAVEALAKAGFVRVEPGSGKKSAKLVPLPAAYDFSARVRAMHRYRLLARSHRDDLVKYCRHVFYDAGEIAINQVLAEAEIETMVRLEDGLENYVVTGDWPELALGSIKAKAARPLVEALRKLPGPALKSSLHALVPTFRPADLEEALAALIHHLVLFEDLKEETFEIAVGFLPEVKKRLVDPNQPRVRPSLVVVEHPKDVAPPGGHAVNDLRIFLLEVAQEAPRLRQDGGIFAKEEPRFLDALPPHPEWFDKLFEGTREARLYKAHEHARFFKFVEVEAEEKASWLRLSGKGQAWLSSGLEEQYVRLYGELQKPAKAVDRYGYDYHQGGGDSQFLGIFLNVAETPKNPSYYHAPPSQKPEDRDRLREAFRRSFAELPVGVFHRWESVLAHLSFGDENPLVRGVPPKASIYLGNQIVPKGPGRVEVSAQVAIEAMMRVRLLPFGAFRAAIDDQGRLCVARLPRSDGYFGKPYEAGEESTGETRVIVQPDFSLLVIGLDPAPAAELAPFCERSGGHAGQGVLSFKITRDAVVRAASQGLSGRAIVNRLEKHASVDVPENVLREVQEWADWVRLVNVRQVTVVRCPDTETVARVISALGKKAERLGDTLVALHAAKLAPADRQKLQEQGILVTKDDITPAPAPAVATPTSPTRPVADADAPSPAPKKRGRPKKAR